MASWLTIGSDIAAIASGRCSQQFLGCDTDFMVFGAEGFCNQVGIDEFVPALAANRFKTDRIGLEVTDAGLGDQADQQARVHAPGQQHAYVNCRHQPAADCSSQLFEKRITPLSFAERHHRERKWRFQYECSFTFAVLFDDQIMPRLQFANAPEDRLRGRHDRVEIKVEIERDRIDSGIDSTGPHQRRKRRGEAESLVGLTVIQRLDTQPVPAL